MEQVDVALVSKFDAWLDLLDTYRIEVADSGRRILRCSCPGGHRWCRHKQMLVQFCKQHRMDKGWFFNWETKAWKEPLRHG